MATNKKKHKSMKVFEELLKEVGEPIKKEGVSVIQKNGKVYVFNYRKKKKK